MDTIEARAVDVQRLSRQLAEFIALYEVATEKIARHEVFTGQRMADIEARFQGQLSAIEENIAEFKNVFSEMGIARWRLAAEEALKFGKEHVETLHHTAQALLNEIKEAGDSFASIRDAAILQINDATKLLGLNEFRQATQDYRDSLEQQTDNILDRLDKSTRWLSWQRFMMIILVAVLSAMATAFVLTNQFPWETRQQASLERNAGKALLKAWPHLSKEEQDYLKSLAA